MSARSKPASLSVASCSETDAARRSSGVIDPPEMTRSVANRFAPIGFAHHDQSAVERMLAELRAVVIEDIGDRDPRALRHETTRLRRSLSTGGSSDERDFFRKPICHAVLPTQTKGDKSR